jgi:predicted 2-oxoglutarate/Fe(II)-dependent dioxygenase YbiX
MGRGIAEPAEVLESDVTLDRAARHASSIEVDPTTLAEVEAQLDVARDAIAAHYKMPLVRREGPGFVRYGPGGFYRLHRDRASDADWPGASKRLISLIVFLNSSRSGSAAGEFSGGELVIFPELPGEAAPSEALEVVPRQGMLVAFHAVTLHEVRPVAGGMRDVIVDWYY